MGAINLLGPDGEPVARLRSPAIELIEQAEQLARDRRLSKPECLPIVLREHIEGAGFIAADADVDRGTAQLEAVRQGKRVPGIDVKASYQGADGKAGTDGRPAAGRKPVQTRRAQGERIQFFDVEREYPDDDARDWYDGLIGLDEHKRRRAEAQTDGCELARHLQMSGRRDGDVGQDAEEVTGVVDDGALAWQQLVEFDPERTRIHGAGRVSRLEIESDVESRDAGQVLRGVEELRGAGSLGQHGQQLLGHQAGIAVPSAPRDHGRVGRLCQVPPGPVTAPRPPPPRRTRSCGLRSSWSIEA